MNDELIKKIIENYKRFHDIQSKLLKEGEDDDILNGQIYALEWILKELDYNLDEVLEIKLTKEKKL